VSVCNEELQLKPTHIPFKLVCYWEELLEKYSTASEYDRQRGLLLANNINNNNSNDDNICGIVIMLQPFHEDTQLIE